MSAHPYFLVRQMEPRNLFNENFVDSYLRNLSPTKFKSYTVYMHVLEVNVIVHMYCIYSIAMLLYHRVGQGSSLLLCHHCKAIKKQFQVPGKSLTWKYKNNQRLRTKRSRDDPRPFLPSLLYTIVCMFFGTPALLSFHTCLIIYNYNNYLDHAKEPLQKTIESWQAPTVP